MPYCLVTDVEAIEAGRNIVFADGASKTSPSLTQVNGFIGQIYDEINQTILRAGYQIPITANDYLKQCNAMGGAWMVELSMGIQGTAESQNVIKNRELAYKAMLVNIGANPRIAGAITAAGSQDNLARSDGTSNWDNADASFKVSRQDW